MLFASSLLTLFLSERLGSRFSKNVSAVHEDFGLILTATLTLLGLILGFTFSMAVGRYDQRKICEAEEANAVGTEYLRTDLLPASEGANVRNLLAQYLDQRILFYQTRNPEQLQRVDHSTTQLEAGLWTSLKSPSLANQSAVLALAVSGMNDVINSRGYTQAAWRNRVPLAAWGLLGLIAIAGNFLVGLYLRGIRSNSMLILVMPTIMALSFFLIADIDAPRGGLIHVQPANLMELARTMRPEFRRSGAASASAVTSQVKKQDKSVR